MRGLLGNLLLVAAHRAERDVSSGSLLLSSSWYDTCQGGVRAGTAAANILAIPSLS